MAQLSAKITEQMDSQKKYIDNKVTNTKIEIQRDFSDVVKEQVEEENHLTGRSGGVQIENIQKIEGQIKEFETIFSKL